MDYNRLLKPKLPVPIIANILKRIRKKGRYIEIKALCVVKLIRTDERMDTGHVGIKVGEDGGFDIKFRFKYGIPVFKGWRINVYTIRFHIEKAEMLDIQNKLIVAYKELYFGRILYNAFDLKKGYNRHSKVIKENGTAIYMRQTIKNTMYLTVREENIYDYALSGIKVLLAYIASKLMVKRDFILMYEKESSKYEESASVLYEKLIDKGYDNVYFIIDRNNPQIQRLDAEYKANLLYKNTFRHLIYFFKCKKFIGTETIGHAIQLRAANRLIVNKVQSKNISYVFLQHGVMYMISLDSDMRTGFRQTDLDLYRVVVSSELEAQHFIELGGFERDELYITGLAKFDRSYRYNAADKIVVMLTWRRWESNIAHRDFQSTKYYKMLERIVNAVPEDIKEKLIVLPHPLMKSAMEKSQCELSRYMTDNDSYDEVLRTCDLLITDYSSIAYDAFYRGSNVIFYWEEKEECIEHYGEDAKLLLNEDNVFGDVCFNQEQLEAAVKRNYGKQQEEEYVERYGEIVEFDDNHNSNRLIECLVTDKII